MSARRFRAPAGLALGAALAASAAAAEPPAPVACAAGVPEGTRCLGGRDEAGAFLRIAVPAGWNGVLVVHAHGGPELGAPRPARVDEDLARWSVWIRAGYAYAASGFQGGVAVRSAAEDTERVRRLFGATVAAPRRTVLHGQSWGATVAAKGAETFGAGGARPYDAVLLTSGVLGNGALPYDFRYDLRVVYQAVCGNHPAPGEPAYPLWLGLPEGAALTRAELARRVDECTGVRRPAAERGPAQAAALAAILGVVRIEERSLVDHLAWGTWHFQDIALRRLGGRSAFGNDGVRYAGSPDDAALNARVERQRIDPEARAAYAEDAGIAGRIAVPVLTVHGVGDPTAFVELESAFREVMERGGSGDRLVQLFTADAEHRYLSDAAYVAAIEALLGWVERGEKPTPAGVAARCAALDPAFAPAAGCRFLPGYAPAPLAARVSPR